MASAQRIFDPIAEAKTTISADPNCIWETVFDMGNWSNWNSVFDITIDGLPEIEKELIIKSTFRIGPAGLSKERIWGIDNSSDTFKRLCWEILGIGLAEPFEFLIPLPQAFLSTERCIELTKIEGQNATQVRNFIKYDVFPAGYIVYAFYGQQTETGFKDFGLSLMEEVESSSCAF